MPRMGAILVFDNDLSIAELISAILSDEGYVVRMTLDCMPAWAARAVQPPALIVLDLALPTQTVAIVRDYARRHYPFEVPIVITTTNSAIAAADTARDGDEYLLKPFALDDLLACVACYVQLPRDETQPLLTVKPQERAATLQPLGIRSVCV
jgi:two-component system OmpR family response regulator